MRILLVISLLLFYFYPLYCADQGGSGGVGGQSDCVRAMPILLLKDIASSDGFFNDRKRCDGGVIGNYELYSAPINGSGPSTIHGITAFADGSVQMCLQNCFCASFEEDDTQDSFYGVERLDIARDVADQVNVKCFSAHDFEQYFGEGQSFEVQKQTHRVSKLRAECVKRLKNYYKQRGRSSKKQWYSAYKGAQGGFQRGPTHLADFALFYAMTRVAKRVQNKVAKKYGCRSPESLECYTHGSDVLIGNEGDFTYLASYASKVQNATQVLRHFQASGGSDGKITRLCFMAISKCCFGR